MIERLTEVPEIGKLYTGTVRRVEAYGAFVEILPGTDGLVHISELAPYRVREVRDVVKEGDEITVKVIDIDAARQGPAVAQGGHHGGAGLRSGRVRRHGSAPRRAQ